MKTAISLLKLVAIIIAMVFLASCGNKKKARIANDMNRVKFDIELLDGELQHIDKQMNSFRFVDDMAFVTNGLSEEQLKIKREKAVEAKKEYSELANVRSRVFFKMVLLKVKYDSLKTELEKY